MKCEEKDTKVLRCCVKKSSAIQTWYDKMAYSNLKNGDKRIKHSALTYRVSMRPA